MRSILATVVAVLCLLSITQSQSPDRQDPDWVRALLNKRMVYSVPGMDAVGVRKDIVYKRTGSTELKADIYLPFGMQKAEKRGVVIFIHGGYLPSNLLTPPKEWLEYRSFGRLAAASGFVGVTFNHRFFRNFGSLPDAQSDLDELIAFVRDHADSFNVDKDRLTLWGFSGAGYLFSKYLRESPPYVRGLITYYCILDFTPEERAAPERVPADLVQKFSAVQALKEAPTNPAPIFVVRAGLDHPARNATMDHFIAEGLARNADIRIVNHPSGHHGFDIEDDNDISRKIVASTLEFVRAAN